MSNKDALKKYKKSFFINEIRSFIYFNLKIRKKKFHQLAVPVTNTFLAAVTNEFGITGRFEDNVDFFNFFDLPSQRHIGGGEPLHKMVEITNFKIRRHKAKSEGTYQNCPKLVVQFHSTRNF